MSDQIPHLSRQPLPVDFIDNRLPLIHKAFTFPQVKYDPKVGRYLPKSLGSADIAEQKAAALMEYDGDETIWQLGQPTVTDTMAFWDKIYDKSMEMFKDKHPVQPKGRIKDGFDYSIREKTTWADVYPQLEKALERYIGGKYKKYRRVVGDHVAPLARLGVKVTPTSDITSPVLAAVQILLDAFETSAEVREKMTTSVGHDELERRFRCIETFLSTFPEDVEIYKASISLVVAIFKAVEDAIGFFLMNDLNKSLAAIFHGKKYQKQPLSSISEVQTSCDKLIESAQNSHIMDTKKSMNTILERTAKTEQKIDIMTEVINSVLRRLSQLGQQQEIEAGRANRMQQFLEDGVKMHKRELKKKNKQIRGLEAKVRDLELRRERTPSPDSQSLQQPPPLPAPLQRPMLTATPQILPYQSQDMLLLPAQTSQASRWFSASYQGQQHLRNPIPTVQIQTQPARQTAISNRALLAILDIPRDLDEVDQAFILEGESFNIPLQEQRKADLLLTTAKFRHWIVSPRSSELLVHGEFASGSAWHEVSALSHFCATFVRAMGTNKTYLPLVHFCGSHIEGDDRQKGAGGMVRSLVAQLLRRWAFDGATMGELDVDLDQISKRRVSALCKLLVWLINRLPEEVVVVCVIDGISHYETDEFEEDMLEVLDCLLRLARNNRMAAPVKLLVTSPTTTDSVQDRFCDEDDGCFISLAEVRDTLHVSNAGLLEEDSDNCEEYTDTDEYEGLDEDEDDEY